MAEASRAWGESEASSAIDEADGFGSGLPEASVESERGGASKVSISA
jgi:hypothetical protein